jgi:hypothetical protein
MADHWLFFLNAEGRLVGLKSAPDLLASGGRETLPRSHSNATREPPMPERPQDFRLRAAECERRAPDTSDPHARETLPHALPRWGRTLLFWATV